MTHQLDEAILLSDRMLVMSRPPSRLLADLVVPLPKPRWGYDFRAEAAYIELQRHVRDLLQRPAVA